MNKCIFFPSTFLVLSLLSSPVVLGDFVLTESHQSQQRQELPTSSTSSTRRGFYSHCMCAVSRCLAFTSRPSRLAQHFLQLATQVFFFAGVSVGFCWSAVTSFFFILQIAFWFSPAFQQPSISRFPSLVLVVNRLFASLGTAGSLCYSQLPFTSAAFYFEATKRLRRSNNKD